MRIFQYLGLEHRVFFHIGLIWIWLGFIEMSNLIQLEWLQLQSLCVLQVCLLMIIRILWLKIQSWWIVDNFLLILLLFIGYCYVLWKLLINLFVYLLNIRVLRLTNGDLAQGLQIYFQINWLWHFCDCWYVVLLRCIRSGMGVDWVVCEWVLVLVWDHCVRFSLVDHRTFPIFEMRVEFDDIVGWVYMCLVWELSVLPWGWLWVYLTHQVSAVLVALSLLLCAPMLDSHRLISLNFELSRTSMILEVFHHLMRRQKFMALSATRRSIIMPTGKDVDIVRLICLLLAWFHILVSDDSLLSSKLAAVDDVLNFLLHRLWTVHVFLQALKGSSYGCISIWILTVSYLTLILR